MTTTAVVLSLDQAWVLPVTEVIDYSEGNAWVYVRTPRGRYYAHRDESPSTQEARREQLRQVPARPTRWRRVAAR